MTMGPVTCAGGLGLSTVIEMFLLMALFAVGSSGPMHLLPARAVVDRDAQGAAQRVLWARALAPLEPGRYLLLDARGPMGEVEPSKVRSRGPRIYFALVGTPRRDPWTESEEGGGAPRKLVVIGPLASTFKTPRLMDLGAGYESRPVGGPKIGEQRRAPPSSRPMPMGRSLQEIDYAVDLDEDGKADLVTWTTRRMVKGPEHFLVTRFEAQTWLHRGDQWVRVARASSERADLVGP